MKSSRSNSGKVFDWSNFLNTLRKREFWSFFLYFFIKREKMKKKTCDVVLFFPPIRLSVLLIYFREKSRGCIESSQILNSKNSHRFAFKLHFYSKKLKHFYYFFLLECNIYNFLTSQYFYSIFITTYLIFSFTAG